MAVWDDGINPAIGNESVLTGLQLLKGFNPVIGNESGITALFDLQGMNPVIGNESVVELGIAGGVDFTVVPGSFYESGIAQFTDLSSETPTSWSWKKRVSGISNEWVEFSTNQNPSELFSIE